MSPDALDGSGDIAVSAALRELEPLFHTDAFGRTIDRCAARMVDEYWEIGASGRRYDRAEILARLAASPPVSADEAGWEIGDFAVRRVGADVWLATYRLDQCGRLSRRATLWLRSPDRWQVVYHQGTLVADR